MEWTRQEVRNVLEPAGWVYHVVKDSASYTMRDKDGRALRQIVTTFPALIRVLTESGSDSKSVDVLSLCCKIVNALKTHWLYAHIKLDSVGDGEVRVYWRITMTGEGAEGAVTAQNKVVNIKEALTPCNWP